MRIPTFWRLVLSHLGILLLSGAACLYSIVQLGSVSGSARSALATSQRVIAYEEALIDSFLSQVRYGGKYLLTHTEGRHEQLLQFKKDFIDYLDLLKQLEQSESIGASLSRLERLHEQYHDLFDREAAYIRANQNYGQTRYQQERDKIVENTLEEFDLLKAQLRTKVQDKLESVDRGARTARRIAIITTLIVLVLGTLFSLKVSRSLDASLSEATQREPVFADPWIQNLKIPGVSLMARMWNTTKFQLNRCSALTLCIIGYWRHRSASPKNHPAER
jgi:hypothetical protein